MRVGRRGQPDTHDFGACDRDPLVDGGWLNPPGLDPVELEKRTLTNLYNERPTWLQHAHAALDAAVFAAYGWPVDLPDQEILARLLALNLEREPA